jgi:protein-S-isoprenylcysteine O-methyltransferase Ste14
MKWSAFDAADWFRWVGVALGMCVVPAVHWLLTALGSNVSETVLVKERHELVTSAGPYRWIRHPLYATGIALFVALGLMASNWFILGMALIAMVLIRTVVVPREERELISRFGSQYELYRRRTGAMLPRVFSG